ncbi:hypothetical protein [Chitinivibrio alkaliphilus]|uniref:Lipoprotein n=1 Tax=Chitinivibrio alkaliphilus ACht1 TaxID=1313304 RepID=U7D8Y3_9BACT|nr:hypothetical protein [Chitinivibrio alkaliphilus]ERP39405.1 hypothetical protein CALK_0209 [Chitinivibrio alkaliphilus ACht1]
MTTIKKAVFTVLILSTGLLLSCGDSTGPSDRSNRDILKNNDWRAIRVVEQGDTTHWYDDTLQIIEFYNGTLRVHMNFGEYHIDEQSYDHITDSTITGEDIAAEYDIINRDTLRVFPHEEGEPEEIVFVLYDGDIPPDSWIDDDDDDDTGDRDAPRDILLDNQWRAFMEIEESRAGGVTTRDTVHIDDPKAIYHFEKDETDSISNTHIYGDLWSGVEEREEDGELYILEYTTEYTIERDTLKIQTHVDIKTSINGTHTGTGSITHSRFYERHEPQDHAKITRVSPIQRDVFTME